MEISLIDQINHLVQKASQIAIDLFGSAVSSLKADRTIVTEADLQVERFLCHELSRLIPGSDFLGEEGVADKEPGNSDYLWIVDPIDGSSAYSRKLPIWGISVALFKARKPYLASVNFPLVGEHFWNDAEGRAYWNGRRLKTPVPNLKLASDDFVCIPSHSYYRCEMEIRIKARSLGSTCYHILLAARDAVYGAVLGDLKIWDIAAAATIAQTNGVLLFTLQGDQVRLDDLIDSSPIQEPLVICLPDRLPQILSEIRLRA